MINFLFLLDKFKIDGYIIPKNDEYFNEYISPSEDRLKFLSNFSGSAGFAIILKNKKYLFVDGRYSIQAKKQSGKNLPDRLVACVGGGSNALGLFHPFINDNVKIIGVEAAGKGIATNEHAATLSKGKFGVLHGAASYMLQDDNGQVTIPYSLSAGLDYPGIGPEHSFLHKIKRVSYHSVTDDEAVNALQWLSEKEGIIPALETAHALAYLLSKKNYFGN